MRTVLKWIGIILGVVVVIVVLAVGAVFIRAQMMISKTHEASAIALTLPTDAASVERGHHIVTTIGACTDCHGDNMAGGIVIDDPALGRIVSANLTTGRNGLGSQLSDADFARVLRYGVKPDGHSVLVMPSTDYTHFNDADLASVIAYLRSLPPADTDWPATELRPLGYILLGTGQLPIVTVERMDFSKAGNPDMVPAVTAEYGHYLASIACMGCHGEGLSGGQIIGAPPDFPLAANLTPSGEVGGWSEADFSNTIHTGKTPSGRELDPEMPWQKFSNMTEDELKAIWLYVHSVPSRPAGTH